MSMRAITAQTVVETKLTLRRGESLLVTLGIPVGILVFFSRLDAAVTGASLEFLVPGVFAIAVMSSAMVSLGIATGFERRFGVLKRLGSTPLARRGLLWAKVGNVLCIQVLQLGVLIGVAALLGYRFTSGLIPALAFLTLGSIAFAGIGMFLAGTLRADANLAVVNALFLIFVFLGGMAYPLDKLPNTLAAVAQCFPAAALATLVRNAMNGAAMSWSALGILAAWAVVMYALTVRTFRWEE
ncbi:MAG: ABC transporter permease [Acidimicrobiia bacterium]